jgi:hypothetical protein
MSWERERVGDKPEYSMVLYHDVWTTPRVHITSYSSRKRLEICWSPVTTPGPEAQKKRACQGLGMTTWNRVRGGLFSALSGMGGDGKPDWMRYCAADSCPFVA